MAMRRDDFQRDPLDGGRPGSETFSWRGIVLIEVLSSCGLGFKLRLPGRHGEMVSRFGAMMRGKA